MNPDLKKWASAGERLLRTFATAFLGVYVLGLANGEVADLDVLKKAAIAGLAAAGDLALSLLGGNLGNKRTPSLLPKPLDPTTKPAPIITTDTVSAVPLTPARLGAVLAPKPRALGLKPHGVPDGKLLHAQWFGGTVPAYAAKVDRLSSITIGLDGNDQYGDCGPTSCDNHYRIWSKTLTGTEVDASQDDVFDLYRRSGNPNFDPATDADDNGVDMVTMMKALKSGGLAGRKIVAYAKLADMSDPSIYAAIDLFGAVLFAVDLQTAQQTQSDVGYWDYKKSSDWGGHAIVAGRYDSTTGDIWVGSWGKQIRTTPAFREHQLQEVWIPIWDGMLDGTDFAANVDLNALAADYKQLTGGTLPISTGPVPTPPPTPPASGAPFPGALDVVAARIAKAAAAAKLSVTDYQNKVWKAYFRLK